MDIQGTDNPETILGTYDLTDTILALGGNDIVRGLFGNDTIDGGDGNDQLFGGFNDDILIGGTGNDLLDGGSGDDQLTGGDGIDILRGGDGNDLFLVNSLAELLGDTFDGGTGIDGLAIDLSQVIGPVTFSIADFLIQEALPGGGSFVNIERFGIRGTSAGDDFTGYALDDILDGGGGNDTLRGGAGNDQLLGGDGDDTITGGIGSDNADGGAGNDIMNGGFGVDLLAGGDGNDRIFGMEGFDSLEGDNGNDMLFGGAGNDKAGGGAGLDMIFGEDGDDELGSGIIDFGILSDDLAAEHDVVDGGLGDDRVIIGVNDTAHGGAGTDHLRLTFQTSLVAVNFVFSPAAVTLANGAAFDGFETLSFNGGLGADVVTGGALSDLLFGGLGNDTLMGGAGGDTLSGEAGNDILRGGLGDDTLVTDIGNDRLFGDAGNDRFSIGWDNFGADIIDGGADSDAVIFDSTSISVLLDLTTQALNDGIAKNDRFFNIEGFVGTTFDDTLLGDARANHFEGGGGDDRLDGRAGNDELIGGFGSDILTGGAGNDIFGFGFDLDPINGPLWRADVVTDFTRGQDKLAIALADFGFDAAHPFQLLLGTDPQAVDPGPVFLFETDTGRLWHDADGNGPELDRTLVATLQGVTALTVADFLFV